MYRFWEGKNGLDSPGGSNLVLRALKKEIHFPVWSEGNAPMEGPSESGNTAGFEDGKSLQAKECGQTLEWGGDVFSFRTSRMECSPA